MLEIYRKLRPGEPPTLDSAETLLNNLFFDPRRYDLSIVGRYKFNKKLTLWSIARDRKLALPVADPTTGEILFDEGHVLTGKECRELDAIGVGEVVWTVSDITNALMAIPNIIMVLLLSGLIAKETKHYVYEGNLDERDEAPIPQLDSK